MYRTVLYSSVLSSELSPKGAKISRTALRSESLEKSNPSDAMRENSAVLQALSNERNSSAGMFLMVSTILFFAKKNTSLRDKVSRRTV